MAKREAAWRIGQDRSHEIFKASQFVFGGQRLPHLLVALVRLSSFLPAEIAYIGGVYPPEK